MEKLLRDIEAAINRNSAENNSNTPDFILSEFMLTCLMALDAAVKKRDKWYGVELRPGSTRTPSAAEQTMRKALEQIADLDFGGPSTQGCRDRTRIAITALRSVATPEAGEPSWEAYRCQSCGQMFDHQVFSHGVARHHPSCDGSCAGGCPVEVECGPVVRCPQDEGDEP